MPTRRSAAADASPPMPAPMIATERGFAKNFYPDVISGWAKPRLRQCVTTFLRRQRIEKRLHRRTLLSRRHQREIIMLFRERNETEFRRMRDRRNRHTPVGAMLRYGSRDRIMRARLIPVTVRPVIAEQAVDQDPRARPLVAVEPVFLRPDGIMSEDELRPE